MTIIVIEDYGLSINSLPNDDDEEFLEEYWEDENPSEWREFSFHKYAQKTKWDCYEPSEWDKFMQEEKYT